MRGLAAVAIALAALAGTTTVSAQATSAEPVRAAPSAEYRLGAGDVVRITVFQNPELTLESRLTEGGQISFPLLGAVRLGGLSVPEAEKVLVDGLTKGNFLRNPQVTIIVLQVRGSQANVLGQFNRPGRYPLEMAETKLSDGKVECAHGQCGRPDRNC